MTESTVLVRPRTGIILAGIPRKGAQIPRALAEQWIADHLVVPIEHKPEPTKGPGTRRSK
jgi:hypothetical protein